MLLLNKPPGRTSFQALGQVKKALGTKKVGHTGTLDKFASGLLIALAGKATKLVPRFEAFDKTYIGEITFGKETDTLDPEGSIIAEAPLPGLAALEASLAEFRGEILQKPPAYSALHINGKRAYELARSGEAPEMKARPVSIYSLELLSYQEEDGRVRSAVIRAEVSKGTYIRSLARDIALAAGSRGYLSALTRIKIGDYKLEDALDLETADNQAIIDALNTI
jgi:tRNA pseudouridine55 synthase